MKAIVLGLALFAAPVEATNLNLVCVGGGSRTVITGPLDRPAATSSNFSNQVDIEIYDGGGRIRVPPAMYPEFVSGGSGGWWQLSDVQETAGTITARFRFNMFNKPVVRVDRITGELSIDAGRGQFSAQCEPIDRLNSKPKF